MVPHIGFPDVFKLKANTTNEARLSRIIIKQVWKNILKEIRRVSYTWNSMAVGKFISRA